MQPSDQHKVQLTGSVFGVESCQITTDSDEVRVGSALDADLVVMDPLVPSLAFVIRRRKFHHGASASPCECRWVIEVQPQARVFVNEHLTTRENLAFGDTLTSGCHQFVFASASPLPRNRKSNTTVNDLCAVLLTNQPVPPGFLATCPWHRHLQRLYRSVAWAGALAVMALLLFVFVPRAPKFETIQPPMEVTVIADRIEAPLPDAVRSLKDVQRQTFQAPATPASAISSQPAPVVADMDVAIKTIDVVAAAPPVPQFAQATKMMANLAPAELKSLERAPGMVKRDQVSLVATAPTRRMTLSEAARRAAPGLQPVKNPAAISAALQTAVAPVATGDGIKEPDVRILDRNRAQRLDALAVFKPSLVRFENAGGVQVPVARMSESLAPMEAVKAGDYQIDGKVTEGEITKSWKSGRFRVHAPGNPPPEANPATYCYVGRSELAGQPCLYISFICADPNPDQIIANVSRNLGHTEQQIIYDDSLEIFLDTNNDRRDYNQLIVNARGVYHSAYYASPEAFANNTSQPWDPRATVKSSINREAGQWVCEIQIPFERLGGVPAKGSRWTVNFCRNFRGQKEAGHLQSWFNVYSKSGYFHHPANFGMFEW